MATITSLYIYPIKALHSIQLDTVYTNEFGLAYDRSWMLVDQNGICITQRDIPRLATFRTHLQEDLVTISAGEDSVTLDPDRVEGNVLSCKLWQTEFLAREYSKAVSHWFKEKLDFDARLVQPGLETYRTAKNRPETLVSFQDAQQILVISEATLADLNGRLEAPIPMSRFRPNIVVNGLEAFEEDRIAGLRIGDVELEAVGPCGRCTVTTIDQDSGVKGVEPLKTLASYRTNDGQVQFGQYFRVASGPDGVLKSGNVIEVL